MFEESVERSASDKKIDAELKRLRLDEDEVFGSSVRFTKEDFGICHDCINLYAFKTEYGKVLGKCYQFEITLRGIDNIKHCNRYSRKGEMSMDFMKEIATIIEVDKRKVGF